FSEKGARTSEELSGNAVRGGEADAQRTIQKELRVSQDVELVQKTGARYHLASWLVSLSDNQWAALLADIGLNKASPTADELKPTRELIARLRRESRSARENGGSSQFYSLPAPASGLTRALSSDNLVQSYSGIRGRFGTGSDIGPEFSLITAIYAYHYLAHVHAKTGKSRLKIVMARDPRPSGAAIRNRQIQGFLAFAAANDLKLDIVDLGILPKPVLCNAVKTLEADGGLVI
ncbi:unnamed protein product, partial [marine sediment metagenome]